MTGFVSTRPVMPWRADQAWQASGGNSIRGRERFGPPRAFHAQALRDLPPEACLELLPNDWVSYSDITHYRAVEPFGAAWTNDWAIL